MSMSKTACITYFMIVIQIRIYHIDVSIILSLFSLLFMSLILSTLFVLTSVSWTLCSCPQVDREMSLTQIHSPDSWLKALHCSEVPMTNSFVVYTHIHFGYDGALFRLYVEYLSRGS